MNEIFTAQNLNSYYTSNPKAERTQKAVVTAPAVLPSHRIINDSGMKTKWKELNNGIYQESKKEQNSNWRNFLKLFCAVVLTILGIKGLRKLFK